MNNIRLSVYLDEITKGTTPTTMGGRFMSEGVNFVKAECLNTGRIIDKNSLSYISPEIHKKLNRSILKEGDLLFSIAGHLGKMAIVRKNDLPANTNQAVAILRINQKKADVEFLYYYLCSKQVSEYIGSQCAQSVQPNLNLAQVGELPIIEYHLSYQQKIASVLSVLDSKIELNNRINAELEEMAKTLYDYWFVQFDFPDKNGKPYKTSGGTMVWNEELMRDIPETWEVKRIGEFAQFVNGKGIKKEFLSISGKYAVYGSNGITGYTNEILFDEPVIAIGRVGANYGEVHYCLKPCWISDNAVTAQPLQTFFLWWLIDTLKRIDYKKIAGGSAQPLITQGQLKELKFVVPKDVLFKDFHEKVHPIYFQLNLNIAQNQKLTELRDWLLPMLMNGQVKIYT